MKTPRILSSILVLAVMLLPTIAPLVITGAKPAATVAYAQTEPYIQTSADTYDRIVGIGSIVRVQIYDPNASSRYVYANITVAGTLNKDIPFGYNYTSGYYEIQLNITRAGTNTNNAIVYYRTYNTTTKTWGKWKPLLGVLAEGDTIVISYKASNGKLLTVTLTYKLYELIIRGRLHDGIYWIPRLPKNITLPNGTVVSTTKLYGALDEWRIQAPGYNGNNMSVLLVVKDFTTGVTDAPNATITFTRVPGTILFKPANETEAEKITQLLINISKQLSSPWIVDGCDFAHAIRGDDVRVSAVIFNTTSGQVVNTIQNVPIAIFVSKAEVMYTASSPTQPITIKVCDPDMDFDAVKQENISATLGVWFELMNEPFTSSSTYQQYVVMKLQLIESPNMPGMFIAYYKYPEEPGINLLDPAVSAKLYPAVINEHNNKIYWHMYDLKLDNPSVSYYCDESGEIVIPYHPMSFQVMESSVVVRPQQHCCLPPTITLHITDADANTAVYYNGEYFATKTGSTVLRGVISAGKYAYDIPLYYVNPATGTASTLPGYMLTIYAEGVNSTGGIKYFNLTATKDIYLSFYKTASGTLEYILDLSNFNWTKVNEEAANQGYQLKNIVVIVTDNFAQQNNQIGPITQNATIKLQNVSIKLERTEIPVALKRVMLVSSNTTYPPIAPGMGADVLSDKDAIIIPFEIIDNGSNTQCCAVDHIPASHVKLELVKYYNGQLAIYKAGNGTLEIPIDTINPATGQPTPVGTCYITVPQNLTETGINTGVFTGYIEIYSVMNNGQVYAGCASPWLEDAMLIVSYVSPSIGQASAKAVFKFYQAKLEVLNPENGKPMLPGNNTIYFGEPVLLKVFDPDANLDPYFNESVRVEYTVLREGVRITSGYLWLQQSNAGSDYFDGVVALPNTPGPVKYYGGEVYIDMNLLFDNTPLATQYASPFDAYTGCTFCLTVNFTYVDQTPYSTAAQAGIRQAESMIPSLLKQNGGQPLDYLYNLSECVSLQTQTATVNVVPYKGKLTIEYTIPDADVQAKLNETLGTVWQDVTNKTGIPALNNTELRITLVDYDRNYYTNQDDSARLLQPGTPTNLLPVWVMIEGVPVRVYIKNLYELGLVNVTEVAPGVFNITGLTLKKLIDYLSGAYPNTANGNAVNYLKQYLGIESIQDAAQLLAGRKIIVGYNDPAAQCPPTPAACAAAGAIVQVWTKGVDMTGQVTVVDAVTGKPKPYYSCACPYGGQCPTGGDLVNAAVKDITLLDYYLDGFSSIASDQDSGVVAPSINNIFDVVTNTTAGFIQPNSLTFNFMGVGLIKTTDGVYIPYAIYSATGRLVCSGQTRPGIIVAANGDKVAFIYYDVANAEGKPVEVKEVISVGTPVRIPPPNKASNVTSETMYVVQGNKFVPTEMFKVNEPVYIRVQLQYNPTTMKQVLQQLGGAGDAFYVLYFIKDNATGKLAFGSILPVPYGFQVVAVGDMSVGFGFTPVKPGTYTITVLPVLSPENPVPVGQPVTFTITVQG